MKIKKQILHLISSHTLLVVVFILAITSFTFIRNELYNVTKDARNLGHTVAELLDGDELERYDLTHEEDENYYTTFDQLQKLKTNFDGCKYMYVFVPHDNDTATYIYDIFTIYELEVDQNLAEPFCTIKPFNRKTDRVAVKLYETGIEREELDIDMFSEYGSLASYYTPIYGSDGKLKAIVGIDYSFETFLQFVGLSVFSFFVLAVLIAALLSVYAMNRIQKRIVAPIENITMHAQDYANSYHDGDSSQYHLEVKEDSNNEIDILAKNMNQMMTDIDEKIMHIKTFTKERERIGTELHLAKKIQKGALPSVFPPFPEHKEFDIFATMNPAKEVGGDFYDFFMIDETHLGLVIADVSGKGIGAALFMMISKILLNNQTMTTKSPGEVLSIVNNRICSQNTAEMFVTVWIGILDTQTGEMVCSNAGHEYPAICRKEGSFEILKDKHGLVIGAMEDMFYKDYTIQLNEGDTIFVYTDGVTEAMNLVSELFGMDRMVASLNAHKDESIEGILHGVLDDIDTFVEQGNQFDDITMLILKYKGKESL